MKQIKEKKKSWGMKLLVVLVGLAILIGITTTCRAETSLKQDEGYFYLTMVETDRNGKEVCREKIRIDVKCTEANWVAYDSPQYLKSSQKIQLTISDGGKYNLRFKDGDSYTNTITLKTKVGSTMNEEDAQRDSNGNYTFSDNPDDTETRYKSETYSIIPDIPFVFDQPAYTYVSSADIVDKPDDYRYNFRKYSWQNYSASKSDTYKNTVVKRKVYTGTNKTEFYAQINLACTGVWIPNSHTHDPEFSGGCHANCMFTMSPLSLTVSYDKNGGSGSSIGSTTVEYDDNVTIKENSFTRTGYHIPSDNQWNTKKDGTGTYYSEGDKKKASKISGFKSGAEWTDIAEEVTLYAQWEANTYTIKFDGNDSTSGSTAAMTGCEYDKSYKLTANGYKKTGYSFTGWNTKADGSGDAYENKESVKNLTSKNDGTVTLYAQWKANTYTIKFDGNGSTSGSTASMTGCKYDKSYTLTANGYKRTGYSFAGWNTKADGSGDAYKNKESVKNLTSKNDDTVTLYAQWVSNMHTLTVNPNGGTWEGSMEKQYFTKPEGWKSDNIRDAEPDPQIGKRFRDWSFATNGTSSFQNKLFTMGDSDATLTAQYEYIRYDIHYDFAGGAKKPGGLYPSSATYSTGFYVTIPERTGYTFTGWTITGMDAEDKKIPHYYGLSESNNYSNKNDTHTTTATDVWFMNLRSTSGTVDFRADWQRKEYNLTVSPNGGVWEGSAADQSFTLMYQETKEIPDPARTGYTFTGWSLTGVESSLAGTSFAMGCENASLVANWEANHYTIRFDGNGATNGNMNNIDAYYDEPLQLPENRYTRETDNGISQFIGWSMDSAARDGDYADKEEVLNLTKEADGEVVLYALWDDCPWIEAYDQYYTLEQAQSGYITLDELMSRASAGDREDGSPIEAGIDEEKHTTFDIWDYLSTDFTSFDSKGSVTETYRVIDSRGNVTKKMITVYIVDTLPKDPEPIRTTRFINEKYYYESYENGGLEPDSIWLTNPEYRAALELAFENLRNDTPLYVFRFTHEDILEMREFVVENGFGNEKNADALQRFYDRFMEPNLIGGSAVE
ncbi:MAG: InlB B-repeat-containing protein [Roseburia sp.]